MNNDTIANFEQVLDSARSIREAPLTQHQLHLTQQMEDIVRVLSILSYVHSKNMTQDFYELKKGAPGYGNKAVPSLDFGALTLSDNLIQGKLHFSERLNPTLGPWDGTRCPGTVRGRPFKFIAYKCNGSR